MAVLVHRSALGPFRIRQSGLSYALVDKNGDAFAEPTNLSSRQAFLDAVWLMQLANSNAELVEACKTAKDVLESIQAKNNHLSPNHPVRGVIRMLSEALETVEKGPKSLREKDPVPEQGARVSKKS